MFEAKIAFNCYSRETIIIITYLKRPLARLIDTYIYSKLYT